MTKVIICYKKECMFNKGFMCKCSAVIFELSMSAAEKGALVCQSFKAFKAVELGLHNKN